MTYPTPDQFADMDTHAKLEVMFERMTRIETRLVKLMLHLDLDALGNKLPPHISTYSWPRPPSTVVQSRN